MMVSTAASCGEATARRSARRWCRTSARGPRAVLPVGSMPWSSTAPCYSRPATECTAPSCGPCPFDVQTAPGTQYPVPDVPLTLSFPPFARLTVLQFGLLSLLIVPAPEPAPALHWQFSERHPLYVRLKSHEKCRDKKCGQETSSANDIELLYRLKLLKHKDD